MARRLDYDHPQLRFAQLVQRDETSSVRRICSPGGGFEFPLVLFRVFPCGVFEFPWWGVLGFPMDGFAAIGGRNGGYGSGLLPL